MASLELSMIVKNAAAVLERCLCSARPAVDTILIGDTGSTDATVKIARRCGARVIDVPWQDDFAQARNTVLAASQSDWILVLDDDEMLEDEAAAKIRRLIDNDTVLGYDVRIWNYVPTLSHRLLNTPAFPNPHRLPQADAFAAYVEHVNVRLFRRHPEVFFEGRVHESVADRMKRMGLPVANANFLVHHLGTAEDSEAEHAEKMRFYRDLGRKKLAEMPNDVRALWELGLAELEQFRQPAEALRYIRQAVALNPDSALLWTYVGICQLRLGQATAAQEALAQARRRGAQNALYLETVGDVQYAQQNFTEARQFYTQAIAAGSLSNVVASKLGVCELRLGSPQAGLQRIQQAIAREPEFGELYDILTAAALYACNPALAAETAEKRLRIGQPTAQHFLLAAQICAQLADWPRAVALAQAGCARFPDNVSLAAAWQTWQQKLHP